MTRLLAYLLSTGLTLMLGGTLMAACGPRAGRSGRSLFERVGLAFFLGLFAVCALFYLYGAVDLPLRLGPLAGAAAALAAAAALVAWLRGWRPAWHRPRWRAMAWGEWLLAALILSKVLYVGVSSVCQLRRTDDAFTLSLSLCRHIYDLAETRSFISRLTGIGYPKLPAFAMAWQSLAHRPWYEYAPNLAYLNWYAFYLCLLYGLARSMAGRFVALALTYVVGALPLVLNHATVIGYSDLPLGMVASLAMLYAYSAARTGRASDAVCAGVFTLVLPLIKLEGLLPYFAIAACCLGLGVAWGRGWMRAPSVWLTTGGLAVAAVAALSIMFSVYGAQGPSFLSAETYKRIYPGMHLSEVGPPFAAHLLWDYNNWMLVGPLSAAIVVALGWRFAARPEFVLVLFAGLSLVGSMYALCCGPGYAWVVDGTLVNRLLLQLAPATVAAATLILARLAGVGEETAAV
jgi:hypothetical protein